MGRNPSGNRPRYPFVAGEVDTANGLLMRDSVVTIDERLSLSNFYAREDRETGCLLLFMGRSFARGDRGTDVFLYTLEV